VAGSAHFSWVPPQTFQYRAVFGSTISSTFTITVTPPTVTGTADAASIASGASAGATVAVSPDPGSGTARLEYLNGSTWTPFATPVTLVGGSAHFSWVPPQTFQYRALFGTTISPTFTITVAATS
jgi:thiamine monophosphate kinase